MNELLFSYGTLQKAEVQRALFGRTLNGAQDMLAGYALAFVEIKDESFLARGEEKTQLTAIISKNDADRIAGTVLEISAAELRLIDEYEPDNYRRIKIALQSGKEAWIYVAT